MASEDFVVVHGPPGTGKTTFIAELAAQLFRKTPGQGAVRVPDPSLSTTRSCRSGRSARTCGWCESVGEPRRPWRRMCSTSRSRCSSIGGARKYGNAAPRTSSVSSVTMASTFRPSASQCESLSWLTCFAGSRCAMQGSRDESSS
ncbi:MAG: AAA family ATPase [Microthrixaceae bacterium]|nr:AAA family ATPase [Microthrixaceae bacterium]